MTKKKQQEEPAKNPPVDKERPGDRQDDKSQQITGVMKVTPGTQFASVRARLGRNGPKED